MAKHVIFLVHGMGDTKPGWSEPVQALIKEKYKLYRVAGRKKFDANFSFREINYNHVFQSHIEKWRDNAAAVTNLLQVSGVDNNTLNYLNSFSDKASRTEFASTHVLDVILYRFMKGIKSQVIAHISEQIVGKLNETSTVPPWSVVSHSLGTAVMHDVLQANMTTDHFPLSAAHGAAVVYMTLANVSRVLQDSDTNVYTSAVRPALADKSKPYSCQQFVNVSHKLDPFTLVNTFKPAWEKGASNPLNNLRFDSYEDLKIDGLTGWNPHDLSHYLSDPRTHVCLFRKLLTRGSITDAELNSQLQQHSQTTVAGQFKPVKDAVTAIQLNDSSSFADVVKAWTNFQTTVQQLAAQAGQ